MSDYDLVEKIGQGGMGIVYRAIQRPLERTVAVKLLPSSLMADPEAKARFLREVRACTTLNHPNIIKILDCGELKGQPFFAMEYLEAKTIRELLNESGPLPVPTVVDIFRQMIDALAYCHREAIIHRDIKPHNIMVDRHHHATLMDFGLVKLLDASGITQARKVLGTPNYVAPEILRGEVVGPPADLFSLAAVVYEMLTGEKAFPGKGIREIAPRILKEEPRPVDTICLDCPAGVAKILGRCLRKKTADRYPNADEVLTDLTRLEVGANVRNTSAFRSAADEPKGPSAMASSGRSRPTRKESNPLSGREQLQATLTGAKREGPPQAALPGAKRESPLLATLTGTKREGHEPATAGHRRHGPSLRVLVISTITLGIAFGVVLHTFGPRPVSSPSPRVEVVEPTVEVSPDSAELRWSSAQPYRGQAAIQTVEPPVVSLDVTEPTSTTEHRLRAAGLEIGRTYRYRLLRDGRLIGPSGTFSTPTRAEISARLSQALAGAALQALIAQIDGEAVTVSPQSFLKNAPQAQAIRRRFTPTVKSRVAAESIVRWLTPFTPVQADYFSDRQVRPDPKRKLRMGLEQLEDLRLLCAGLSIEFPLAFRIDEFRCPAFGPDPPRLPRVDGLVGFEFEKALIDATDVPAVRISGAGGPGVFRAAPSVIADESPGPAPLQTVKARVAHAFPEPVQLPVDRIEKLHVGLVVQRLDPRMRFVLSMGPNPDKLEDAVVFRSRSRERTHLWVAIDPLWMAKRSYLKLELRFARSLLGARDDHAKVLGLYFRYQLRRS